ncbi:MAG: 2-amino-4-hydroxy-6-hydroxymethyldihydropteridine diphosphokinase [Planctomycetota bacterium]|nr:2-amino-4-hydroxy-6-hydroxymethyldihydropteridine diphosphokinase [Planctomycetota bacterium]
MTRAVVAIGSNISPRREAIRVALQRLAHTDEVRLVATSALRETDPIDAPPGSGLFVNGACLLETTLGPFELFQCLQEIEALAGRTRGTPNAPRTLDLDLILFGDSAIDTPELTVPHPRAHQRDFVLEPAAEVAPDMTHPHMGNTLAQLKAARSAGATS